MNSSVFFFYGYADNQILPSFPKRRSSGLTFPTAPTVVSDVVNGGLGSPLTWSRTSARWLRWRGDRKSTGLNPSNRGISYAVFCLKKKKLRITPTH